MTTDKMRKYINKKNSYSFVSGFIIVPLWIILDTQYSSLTRIQDLLPTDLHPLFWNVGHYLSATVLSLVIFVCIIGAMVFAVFRSISGVRFLTWDEAFDMSFSFSLGAITAWLLLGLLTYLTFNFGPPLGI